ncbi:hypothetical protein Q0590_36535 [Rhodocytophaga aerolata]|uniref:Uncharacterized protein n=3 Tax=Rhodocytophaga aerolata TaxID=455078 RepID=A0ABT8RIC2_9BACT|nr:hypothetical protein [Rhodocytophaga aerolata]
MSFNFKKAQDYFMVHNESHWYIILISTGLTLFCLIFISGLSLRIWSYQLIRITLMILLAFSLLDLSSQSKSFLFHDRMVLHSDHTGLHEDPMTFDEKWENIYRPLVVSLGMFIPLGLILWMWLKTEIKDVFNKRQLPTSNTNDNPGAAAQSSA